MGFEELAIGILDYTAMGTFRSPLRAGKRKVRGREGGKGEQMVEGRVDGEVASIWCSLTLIFVWH